MIDRGFVRIPQGLVHYRCAGQAGAALPLIVAHGGPGSSAGLVGLIGELAARGRVVAPDMLGNGESDPPPPGTIDIAFYARCLAAVMDRLEIARADFYGHHTGAQVICELAIAHPGRVRRLVLDGVALFPDAVREEFLTRYAPPLVPDADGRHVLQVWNFIRNTTRFFPHYREDEAHAIAGGMAWPPDLVTVRSAEVLRNWATYHISYGAAFTHALRDCLGKVGAPALVVESAGDPLAQYAREAAGLLQHGRVVKTDRHAKGAVIRDWLDEGLS
jgi:pimeloyl-ACP methyl ester carboxylesterase